MDHKVIAKSAGHVFRSITAAIVLATASACQMPFLLDNQTTINKPTTADTVNQAAFDAFFDQSTIKDVSISITKAVWDAFNAELNQNIQSNKEFPVTVKINGVTYDEVGLRVRGNSTRRVPGQNDGYHKAHFQLDFNTIFGQTPGSAEYAARKDRRLFGLLESINLKWPQMQNDQSGVREMFAYKLLAQAGLPAPKTTATHLSFAIAGVGTINYGVYLGAEPMDKAFLKRIYGGANNDGNLYKCLFTATGQADFTSQSLTRTDAKGRASFGLEEWETGYKPTYALLTNKEHGNFTFLKEYIDTLNRLSGTERSAYLERTIDVDQFLRAMAIESWIGSPDSANTNSNNTYRYFSQNMKMMRLDYDFDSAFAGGWWPLNTITNNIYQPKRMDPQGNITTDLLPEFAAMMENPTWKSTYTNYVRAFGEQFVKMSEFEKLFNQMSSLYAPYLNDDTVNSQNGVMQIDSATRVYFSERARNIAVQLGLPENYFETGVVPSAVAPYRLRTSAGDYALTQTADPNVYTGVIAKPVSWMKIDDAVDYGDWQLGDAEDDHVAELYAKSFTPPATLVPPLQFTFNVKTYAFSYVQLFQANYRATGIRTSADWNKTVPMTLVADHIWRVPLTWTDFGGASGDGTFKLVTHNTVDSTDIPTNYLGDNNADGATDSSNTAANIYAGRRSDSTPYYLEFDDRTLAYKFILPYANVERGMSITTAASTWTKRVKMALVANNTWEATLPVSALDATGYFKLTTHNTTDETDLPVGWYGWGASGVASSTGGNLYADPAHTAGYKVQYNDLTHAWTVVGL